MLSTPRREKSPGLALLSNASTPRRHSRCFLCCGRPMSRARFTSPKRWTSMSMACTADTSAPSKGAAARFLCGAEVRSLGRRDGLWHVESTAGAFESPVVVNAAGAWADEVARMAGIPIIGLQPKRRTAFTFDGPPGLGNRVLPMCADAEAVLFQA